MHRLSSLPWLAAACTLGVLTVTDVRGQAPQTATPRSATAAPRPRSAAPARAVPEIAGVNETPAGEADAELPALGSTLPRCVACPEPAWPTPITERWRFRLHVVVDAAGHVTVARIVRVLVGDVKARPVGAMGDVAPALQSSPTARAGLAVLGAVRQWQLERPSVAPLLLVTDVGVGPDVPLAPAKARAPARKPLRVGGDIPPPTKLVDVPPVYPEDAIAARITGTVTIEAVIGTDGSVIDAKVIKGVPMLDAAALAAVRQWKYTPTLLNGEPVPVIVTVTSRFSLQ